MNAKWWTLVAVCAGIFMLLLDITIVNVALPDIQQQFGASLSGLQWVIDSYALSLASLLLTAGSLADLYGRRRVFATGLVLFTVASVLCGIAPSLLFLQLSRAFQGIGGAAMFATALALLSAAYTGRDRGVAFGAFGATTGVAVAIGPVLGGVLTSGLSWRWIFLVNLPICLLALAVSLTKLEESQDPRAGRPDYVGFVVWTGALVALVYGLIRAGQDGFGDTLVVACLVGALVLFAVFLLTQARGDDPMFDLSLLRKPTFVGGLVAAFAVSASIFSLLAYLVIYLQGLLGYSAVGTGVRLLFLSGASFFAATLAGRLTSKVPTKWLIGPGFLLLGVGLFLLGGISVSDSWTGLIPGLTVAGVGVGLINVPLASTAVGVVEPARAGMASGINSTLRQVGIATGIAALGSIFSHRLSTELADRLPAALSSRSSQLADALSAGQLSRVLQTVPAGSRDALATAARAGYVDALNHIIAITTVIAFVAAVACLFLVRQRDFVQQGPPAGGGAHEGGDADGARAHEGPASRPVDAPGDGDRDPAPAG